MVKKDKRVDEYIKSAEAFAVPVLKHFRKLIHQACPDVEETIKWGFPSFEYKGPLCSMASFKKHCVFSFWKYTLLKDPQKILGEISSKGGTAMGNLGRITSLKDLPKDNVILDFLSQSIELNEKEIKLPPRKPVTEKEKNALVIPKELKQALSKNKPSGKIFDAFSYSKKKEYCEWIDEAKTQQTREKRITTALVWIAEGKSRNWKYEKKKQ